MLDDIQRGLERMYRIDTALDVRDFLLDEAGRDAFAPARSPREQLLVAERDGDLELGLFVDAGALRNLAARDPRDGLDAGNLGDFLLTVEGVSHFIYVAWRARARRPVSALELELQAEIDKYVTCVLLVLPRGGRAAAAGLRPRLFDAFVLDPDLDAEERERYRVANSNARTYAARLERYVARGAVGEMLSELRWFYRQGVGEKMAHIAKAA